MDNVSPYATNQRHPSTTQQSNGLVVRFICGDDGWEAFIGGAKPDFYYFGAPKWGDFSTILVLMVLFSMPWTKQQLTNRSVASIVGVCDAVWQWRMNMSNTRSFFPIMLVPQIPSAEQQYWQYMIPCCPTLVKSY